MYVGFSTKLPNITKYRCTEKIGLLYWIGIGGIGQTNGGEGEGAQKKQEPMQNIKYNINAPSQREDWPYVTHSILLTGRYSTPHLAALPLPYPTLDLDGC